MRENSGKLTNMDYSKHSAVLQEIGVWDFLTGLEEKVDSLEQFFDDALAMFNVQTAGGLIEFVISRFLDRFVPEQLLFIIEDSANFTPETYYFRKLYPDKLTIPVTWYKDLKKVFPAAGGAVSIAEAGDWLSPELAAGLSPYGTSVILPMKGIGGIFGFVLFSNKMTAGAAYTDNEITYLSGLIRFFSVGLQNALHHQSSITDLKTGLFNHAYFMRRLEEELFRGHRCKTETSLLLMDIDFFKKLNDAHGHLAGDAVLQEMARVMKNRLRIEDVLSRFGGEEFTLLLPTTPESTAMEIAERLRAAVESLKTSYENKTLSITISIGCATSPAGLLTPQQLMSRADDALYRSKGNGRNRVTLYKPDEYSPSVRP